MSHSTFFHFNSSLFKITNEILAEKETLIDAYNELLNELCRLFDLDMACIAIISNHNNKVEPVYFSDKISLENFPDLFADDPSCSQRAISKKAPVFWVENDYSECSNRSPYIGIDAKSEAIIPIMKDKVVVGLLLLASFKKIRLKNKRELLIEISDQLATVLLIKFLFQSQNILSNVFFSDEPKKSIGFQLALAISQILNSPIVSVRLLSDDFKGDRLVLDSIVGYPKNKMDRSIHQTSESLSWACINNAKRRIYLESYNTIIDLISRRSDIDKDNYYKEVPFFKEAEIRSAIHIPLISGLKVIGIASVYSRRSMIYSERHASYLMILCKNAADAIHREALNRQNENLKNKAIAELEDIRTNSSKTAFFVSTRTLNHEVKDILSKTYIELKRFENEILDSNSEREKSNFKKIKEKIYLYIERSNKLLDEFSSTDRKVEYIDINEFIRSIKVFYHNPHSSPPIYLQLDLSDKISEFRAVKSELRIVFHNIITNAVKAIGEQPYGQIDITTYDKIVKGKKYLFITIHDNGHGIAQENKEDIYKIYYTTFSKGSGVGLFQSKNIIEKVMDGHLYHESSINKFTKFYIQIPYND